ncbi:probable G-protein coupled receptor 158 [Syngnathus acus]|uniref:probable G-protein coupled receptor 158 n=1 Tax=Syngnathus acus TaxID=161584 RepID=UPI0018864872|nr:probable G-protein coupled receptor 158 [Syngnathus acus]
MEAVVRLALLLLVGFVIAAAAARPAAVREGGGAHLRGHRLAHLRGGGNEERVRLPAAVADFLHTGDSSVLEQANCSRRFELPRGGRSPESTHRSALDAVLHAANLLSLVLQANRSGEQSARRDVDWYHAIVRSLLLAEQKIHRAVIASSDGVHVQATRTRGEIALQDLSGLHNHSGDGEWHRGVKHRRKATFQKKVPSQDLAAVGNSLRRGQSLIPDEMHVKWSAPYLECHNGNFVPRWLSTLSAAFYSIGPNMAPEFRGVVRADINLQDVDIDQCSTDGWFAGTHRCNLTTMECLPTRGHGFVLDKYKCLCRKGFYRAAAAGFTRMGGGNAAGGGNVASSSECLPCRPGCAFCKDDTPCAARRDGALRTAVMAFQSLCILVLLLSMLLVYRFRRNKSIRASGVVLLEVILCGVLLLYFPVGILYFQPGVFRCILLRWVRLLGFATVYGTLTLKLYRVLKVFLSRTAQRIPYMTSWRVLRLLAIILLVVCWFLVAWTSAVCQVADRKSALIDVGYTPDGLQFSMCLVDRWDYMMAVAEFLFLLWSVYLCYAVRTVPSAFHEPRYMAFAVHNELVLSPIFYVIRFTLAAELHPDWMLLLFFTHTHLTVTVTLGLLLVPKFLFAGTQMRDDMASEAYEDELDMGRSGSYLNSSITSAWSEHSLDPEDIREELKKLYSQLEIYKRKKMLANNPHLQKKRSSKKGLGRSLMRRITEIPESVHRQCSREDKDGGNEHGSNRSSLCVLKKNPFDQMPHKAAKEESLKNKAFSLKKSHSSYDHVRGLSQGPSRGPSQAPSQSPSQGLSQGSSGLAVDKMDVSAAQGSLLEALMGKRPLNRKSRESLDAPAELVPLVCKSASAHNLSADKKPLHPRASVLRKSLSVIATAKERTLGLAGKNQSDEDGPESKEESEPKNVAAKGRNAKQPAEPLKGKDLYDVSEVCPWEVEDQPTPSESKVQKHVSIAPEESTTVHGGGSRASKGHKQTPWDQTPTAGRQSKEAQRAATAGQEVCPGDDSQSGAASKKQPQPPSKSGNAQNNRAEICPWDFGEQTFPAKDEDTSLKAQVCPWDNPASPEGLPSPAGSSKSKDKKGSGGDDKRQTKAKDKSKSWEKRQKVAEVCPWDAAAHQEVPAVEKRKSANVNKAEVCPWDFEEAGSHPDPANKAGVCPGDVDDKTA